MPAGGHPARADRAGESTAGHSGAGALAVRFAERSASAQCSQIAPAMPHLFTTETKNYRPLERRNDYPWEILRERLVRELGGDFTTFLAEPVTRASVREVLLNCVPRWIAP